MSEPEPSSCPIAWFMAEVCVVDWAASARWYVDVLGLRPVLDDPDRRFLLLEAGTGRLAIKAGPPVADRSAVRLVFQVADVDQMRTRLLAAGVAVTEAKTSGEGYREVRLADPEGTPIVLFAWVTS